MNLARPISRSFLAAAAIVGTLAACSDSTEPDEHELDVYSVTLTVGASSITINRTTGAPSGELIVPVGQSAITATWRRPDGTVEDAVTDAEFQLRIVPTNGSVLSYTTGGAFAGTLVVTGLLSGQTTTAQVSLLHPGEGHEDFGPFTFTIRVQ